MVTAVVVTAGATLRSLLVSEKKLDRVRDLAGDHPTYVAAQRVLDAVVGYHLHRGGTFEGANATSNARPKAHVGSRRRTCRRSSIRPVPPRSGRSPREHRRCCWWRSCLHAPKSRSRLALGSIRTASRPWRPSRTLGTGTPSRPSTPRLESSWCNRPCPRRSRRGTRFASKPGRPSQARSVRHD